MILSVRKRWLRCSPVLLVMPLLGSCTSEDVRFTHSEARTDTGVVISDGFGLRYIAEGDGPPALVVGSSLYYSRIFSTELRQHLRLVFADHRGFGTSPGVADRSAYELDVIVDDIERVRQELNLGPIIVMGHSGHAFMALEYGKKYPQNVTHVVMIGISPSLSPEMLKARDEYWYASASAERKAMLDENLRRLPDEALVELTPDEQRTRAYVRDGPRIWYDAAFDSSPLWDGVRRNIEMFDFVWGEVFRDIDITKGLAHFDRPVFLALGRHDFLIAPPSAWEPLRAEFTDLTIRIFERSGHTPPYEEPALFDRELLQWIRERR